MADKKVTPKKVTTVKELSSRMTAEKASKFLQEERIKKELACKKIIDEAIEKIKNMGCGLVITNQINEHNVIVNSLQIKSL